MSFDNSAGAQAPAPLPIQFVHIELAPLMGGRLSVAMQATLLDESNFEFVGQELANEHVDTLDQAIALIRSNVAAISPAIA
jgi:hypothetical protein